MNEIFGATDMSEVDDLGVAARQAEKIGTDLEEVESVRASKV